jgi:hypothetical protein
MGMDEEGNVSKHLTVYELVPFTNVDGSVQNEDSAKLRGVEDLNPLKGCLLGGENRPDPNNLPDLISYCLVKPRIFLHNPLFP